MMDTKELFSGIAVFIDDEIHKADSEIYKICQEIENENIPTVKYENIPDNKVIPSFKGSAFIVLDWDYSPVNSLSDKSGEMIVIPSGLTNADRKVLLSFIKELQELLFLPIFIFTGFSVESIIKELSEEGLYFRDKPNRIFIKQKSELKCASDIFSCFAEWMKTIPSIYALKEWEKSFYNAKNKMFLDMYNCSPQWANVIWKLVKNDSEDYSLEYGDFITKNLFSRIEGFSFDDEILEQAHMPPNSEVKKIIEGERYIKYNNDEYKQAYTGDLFEREITEGGKTHKKYLLCLSAQCSLSRKTNPRLICISGHEMSPDEINIEPIRLTNEGHLIIDKKNMFNVMDDLKNEEKLIKINEILEKNRDKIYVTSNNDIIERGNNVVVPCISDGKTLVFSLQPEIIEFSKLKNERVGRLLTPYITRIQQKFSQHIVREGVMPVPIEIFSA